MNPSPSQQSPKIDVDTFLGYVRSSGLVDADRLHKALQRMPVSERPRTVARYLVEQNLLTKFQAERLLGGRVEGFFIAQYRILDRLGKGGMGRVFKAEHMTMGRIIALKMLNANLVKTERARDLFEREMRAAARLSHPNIVTAFDANSLNDRCYLVMEFVDGPNLQDLVKESGRLPVTQACDFIRQVAIGLQYAHDLGMVHRDIKPANLLVQKNASKATPGSYVVKILDFGLARLDAPPEGELHGEDSILTNKNSVMGTPDYLPPEQARNLHLADARSDLYSLGCTFYYLLTGQVLFPGGTAIEKMLKHTTDEPQLITELRPDLPLEVAAIVQILLAKDPSQRFQSATHLVQALTSLGDENAAWIPIVSLPVDNQLAPVSGVRLRPVVVPQEDPWANLEDDSLVTNSPTMMGQSGITKITTDGVASVKTSRPTPSSSWKWLLMIWMMIFGIVASVIAVILLVKNYAG